MLELFTKLLLGQQNTNNSNLNTINQNNTASDNNKHIYTNPAYANYPQEAFSNITNTQNSSSQSFNQNFQDNQNQNVNMQNSLNGLANLFGKSDNNMFPILLSLLNKGGTNGISSIMEILSNQTKDNNKKAPSDSNSVPNDTPFNDEILL